MIRPAASQPNGSTAVTDFDSLVLSHLSITTQHEDMLELDNSLVPHAEMGIALRDCKRVEWFFANGGALFDAREALESLAKPGWELWGVVPQSKLGEAHIAFRGVADRVQGWWRREDGRLTFSSPEIP